MAVSVFKIATLPVCLFFLYSRFFNTVDSTKNVQHLDKNRGSLFLKATTLPTVPQLLSSWFLKPIWCDPMATGWKAYMNQENTHRLGKDHCIAGLWFNRIGLHKNVVICK